MAKNNFGSTKEDRLDLACKQLALNGNRFRVNQQRGRRSIVAILTRTVVNEFHIKVCKGRVEIEIGEWLGLHSDDWIR